MNFSLWIFLLLGICTHCHARLGDTEKELVERLGPPKIRLPEQISHQGRMVIIGEALNFNQADWQIRSSIVEGRVAKEHYAKIGSWTEEQFTAILTANAQGATWREEKGQLPAVQRTWKRTDGAKAIWINAGGMTVEHPRYTQASERAKAQADAESRKVPKI